MAQIKPVTVRAAKTNIVIGALPPSALAAPADRRKLPGLEAPRSEALHTTARTHGSTGEQPALHIWFGELINGCSEATSVQLHITLWDAGRVIATSEPWPAGTHNIQPHSLYAFTVNAAEDGGSSDSMQVEAIDVRQW
jgi:hypothetical protein